ncbi:MFS transporter [Massilia antarctica]|uniref:MFS transporter n=1 Tax=Massilia antarctica TaxID=2765360 RepID=UPI0006BB7272|nr:MFS transporter [Massilia sp. H27-R4]MCY0913638.1 MFS transporter [Massilia sp. H27-R4]CUI06045.1 MFS transporter [Janthinobacterium sp. CG23_2]CUU29831.1 MFS transporter [Janthinobacterium sp. CG23_2]
MAAPPQYLKPTPAWEEHEKPSMPGSASMPWHPPHIRFAYACVALLVGITGGLGNALVSANLPAIQGTLGLTPAEAAWLPAAYIMVNVTSNLMVFKFRQQFGLRLFAEIGLSLYAFVTLLHLLVGGFEMAILVRAVSGLAGATTSTLAMLYMLQAAPKKYTGKMLVLGVGIAQIATPLAWLMSPALLDMGQWHNLYLFEAGLALCSLAAVVVLKLPPGIHIKVIEPLDFVTFALVAPAVAMIVAVLAQGFTRWWFDTPWLAYLLIAAVILMTMALFIEHHRANPLIQTRWLMMGPTIRFMIGAFLIRFLTSEQTYGAVGLLRTLGMGPDQMQPLFAVILAGTICGMVASSLTFSPKTVIPQILFSILLFGVAAWLDYGRTSLDRPHDFFVSQFLVALGAGMFMGPMIMIGIMQALKFGADHVVTFVVMLAMTQSLGGFTGAAALSTYQLHREHVHSTQVNAQLNPADPVVAQRLRLQQQIYQGVNTDPALRAAQGVAQLAQISRREANVLAFNDVFALSGVIAILFLGWSLFIAVRLARRQKREAAALLNQAPAGAPAS